MTQEHILIVFMGSNYIEQYEIYVWDAVLCIQQDNSWCWVLIKYCFKVDWAQQIDNVLYLIICF